MRDTQGEGNTEETFPGVQLFPELCVHLQFIIGVKVMQGFIHNLKYFPGS